ncbi:MAG: HAMP domain-containing histidine kinase [Verrucomicrobia bacterium]|nr:HAMP domain-containing histidine kinase [Verrucomicrobiota bacterium]
MSSEQGKGPSPEVMEAMCDLAGHLSHDLNNFMTPILACGQMLKDGLEADHPLYFCGEQIVQAGEECFELSKKLQAMGSRRLGTELLDFNALVNIALQTVAQGADFKPVVRTQLHPEPVVVAGDRTQFQAMVDEFLRNASFAMKDGGEILIATSVEGDRALLRVKDQGVGMTEEVQAQMYKPYFTTHRGSHCRGVGLTMIYGLVKRYQGEITCKSRPGEGAEFAVSLPRAST